MERSTQNLLASYEKLGTDIGQSLWPMSSIKASFPIFTSPFATQWAQQMSLSQFLSSSLHLSQIGQQWTEQSLSLSRMATEALRPLANSLTQFCPEILQTTKFFQALPDFSEYQKLLDEWREAEKTFHETDFWFLKNFLPVRVLLEFHSYPEDGRSQQINQELVELTKDEQFEQFLASLIEESDVLRSRLPILCEAFPAYRSGLYCLATPVLLAQVEGVMGDALLLKNAILVEGNKVYRRGSDGQPARDRKDKRIDVGGMGKLINASEWKNHPLLDDIAEFIAAQLSGDRNGVLHGRDLAYGENAFLAARCLWVLYSLVKHIRAFEDGDGEKL